VKKTCDHEDVAKDADVKLLQLGVLVTEMTLGLRYEQFDATVTGRFHSETMLWGQFLQLETEEHFSRRAHILDNEHLGFAPEPPKTEIGHGIFFGPMGPPNPTQVMKTAPSALRPDQSQLCPELCIQRGAESLGLAKYP